MAWARCPTHGPIGTARPVLGPDGTAVALYCSCGLACSEYHPQGFIEHEEVVALAASGRQPSEGYEPEHEEVALDTEALQALFEEQVSKKGGGYYTLPNGETVRGYDDALEAFIMTLDEGLEDWT